MAQDAEGVTPVTDSTCRKRPKGYWVGQHGMLWRLGSGRLHSISPAWAREQARMDFTGALQTLFENAK